MAIDPNNPFADLPDTQNDPFADLPDAQQSESGIMPALGAGIDKMQELGYRAVKGFTDVGVPQEEQTNALGRAIGQGGALSRWADEGIARNIEEQKAYTPSVASYKDIDSIGDAASYVGEMTAQSVPMMATALSPAGLFAMGGGLSNEAYEAQPEDNKQPWRATASGFGQAGLERLGVETAIGRVFGGEGKQFVKRVGQSMLGEGTTETGQEALAQWGSGKSLDEIENLDEAFVGGALVGGTIRTGTEAGKAAYDKYRGERPELSDIEETDLTQSASSAESVIPDPFADIGPAQDQTVTGNEIEIIPGETAGDSQPNWQFGQNDMPYRGEVTPYVYDGEYEQYRETPNSVPVGAALEAPIIDGEFERPRGLPNRADTIIGEDGRPMQQAQEFADSVGQASNRALPFDDVIYAEDKRDIQVKRNGEPFGGRRAAELTKEFRQAKEQGLNPQVIRVNGGYGWVTDGEQQVTAPENVAQQTQPTITTKPAQKRDVPKKSNRTKVYTPNGRELEVEYAIVDADQLVTSNTDDGRVNPDYPQTLQPRDRTRASSEIQINSIANNLNPALLGESATTGDGAPIISDSGIVESGNGRSLALKRAYQNGKADKYRSALIEQGYDVSGFEKPVLARIRRTQMNDQDLVDYTKESNERSTLSLSASETAKADAKAIGNIIADFKGGDVSAAGNRDFVRKFMQGAVSQSEQASMIDSDGMLSQDGRRRVEAAMIANAYENTELVNDLFESSDNDIKSIGGALLDASGDWAKMRAAKKAGATQDDVDITTNVIDAVNLVRRSRAEGKKLSEMVSQTDLFAGDIDPTTKVVLGIFYGGENFTKPRSRQRVKEALSRYAELASKTTGGDDLFGGELETVKPEQLLGKANEANEQTDQQAEAQTSLLDQESQPTGQSGTGDRGEGQRPAVSGNGQASAESEVKENKEPPKSGFLTPEETQSDNDLTIEQVMDLGPAIAGAGGNAGAGFGVGSLVAKQARDVADKIQTDMREGLTYKEALEKARKSDDFGTEQFEKAARQAYPNKVTEIDAAANEAATSPTNDRPEPTEAQKEAGNYKKGKVRLHGLDISIENPKGSTRKGKDQDGKEWSSEMKHHYGDIKGTTGADGDSIDVFIGDNPESQKVFVVDQIDPRTGDFDEVKVMMGFDDAETAKSGYLSNYDKNWKGLGEITEASVEDFKAWTKRPRKSKQPFALPVKPKKEEAVAKNQEDWGKKITTARKNISVRWNENSTDEEISSKPLSKTWPEKEFDDVGDTYASAFAFAARSEIPRKPSQSYKKQRWVEKVKNYRQLVKDNVVDGLLTGKITKEKMKELGGKRNLQDFFAKVDLLSELDRKDWGKVERVMSYPESMDFNPKTDKLDIPNPKTYVRINGRNREFNSTDPKVLAEQIKPFLDEKVEKPKMKFEVRGRKGSYFINKKGDPEYTRLATFDSSKEAFDFIRNNNSKLVESWESHKARVNVTKADIRNKVNKPRTGEDYRNGKNATAEDFQNTFGIKRGTFGKWVKQGKERQDMLNGTYDALMDLANITGVPPRALSLEGKLGFAFGANGRGKAMAHYEPGEVVINLTKTKGAGSLAHEWFHALDNYFQKKRDTSPTTEKGNFITHNPETYYIGPRGYSVPESRFRDMRGINKNEWRRVEGVRPEVATSFKNLVDTLNGMDFAKRSSRLDKGKAGGYWSSNLEMAARAFESYVKAKMSANGYDNDFLANVTSATDFVRDDNRYPYIKADEIAEVEAAFDDLFNTIESKESDNGDVTLFSVAGTVTGNTNTRTVSRSNANEIVSRFVKGLTSAGKNYVSVVSSYDDLPTEIKDAAKAQGVEYQVKGVFHKGKVHVVLDQHTSALDMETTLFHEAYGHLGIKNLFGDDITKKLNSLFVANGGLKGLRETAKRHGISLEKYIKGLDKTNMPQEMKNRVIMDELLAHMQQSNKPSVKRLAREIVGMIREGLRKLGLPGLSKVTDSDLFYTLKKARDAANNGPSQSPSETLFRTTDDAATFSAPVEKKWSKDWFKRKLQDKFAPIKDMQASIEKATGRELPEDQNAYRAEELFYGKTENDLNKMEKNHVKPLVDAMTSNNIDSVELDQFLIAKHARERNAHIASINPEMQDGGSGMTNAEADAILSRYEQEGKLRGLEAAASEVYKITQKRRELMRDAGLEDESLLDVWDATYEFYVPLKGYAEDSEGNSVAKTGSGFDIRGKESMRAMGRRTIAESPTAHAIQDLSATIIRSRKNEVGRTFLKMVEENPNPDIWEVFTEDNPDTERRIVNGEVKENQPIDMRSRKDDYFSVKVDGQSKYIKLKDKDGLLMKAMKNMGPEQMNTFTRSMSEVTRWLSMVNTSLNPEFTVTNFTRDIQTALFNALAEQDLTDGKVKDKAIAMKMIKGSGKAVKSLWQHSAGKLDEADPMFKWIEEFLSDGAKTGYFDSKEVDKIGTDLADLLDMANGTNKGKLLKAKHKIGDFIENVNGGIENGVRLSAYIEAREAGVTREKAASFAKNLTVNFNRKGEIGTFLNSLYMFFNAAVQGNANFARAIITPKVDEVTGKKSLNMAQKVAVGISLASFGWAALMREMAGYDEDDVPYWDKIPKGVRERNFIIPKTLWGGEPGEYLKIPLPYGYNIFYNLGDAAEAAINSDTRKSGDLAAEMALSVYASFVPLGSPVGDNGAESIALVAAPTITKPIVELATNKNFFGGPIYRENNPYGAQLRDSQMSMRSTGEAYKWMAGFMNDVIGDGRSYKVNDENPWYDVSPDSIEHLVEFSLGGLYRFGSRIYDNVAKSAQGGELESTDIPFARQLNGKVQPYADITQFYDARQQLKNIDAEMDSLRGKERLEFRKEYGDKLRLQSLMSSLDKRMKQLRKQRDRIEINESLSYEEKEKRLQKIEDQMKTTAARFNKQWNKVN